MPTEDLFGAHHRCLRVRRGALVVRRAVQRDAPLSLLGVPQASRHLVRHLRGRAAEHFPLARRHGEDRHLAVLGAWQAQLLRGVRLQGAQRESRRAAGVHAGGRARGRARHPAADAPVRGFEGAGLPDPRRPAAARGLSTRMGRAGPRHAGARHAPDGDLAAAAPAAACVSSSMAGRFACITAIAAAAGTRAAARMPPT